MFKVYRWYIDSAELQFKSFFKDSKQKKIMYISQKEYNSLRTVDDDSCPRCFGDIRTPCRNIELNAYIASCKTCKTRVKLNDWQDAIDHDDEED